MRFIIPIAVLFAFGCADDTTDTRTDSTAGVDSATNAQNTDPNRVANKDTVFQTALPPVFDGDIILQNSRAPQAQLLHVLAGGKYNHVGLIFQRRKDGLLMVVEVTDSVKMTPLTDWVNASDSGHVCLMRLKNANLTLNEEKVKSLRDAVKAYKGVPFDPVLNWDDSGLYSSEFVWKVYNNAMRLTLCPTRTVGDFDISEEEKARLNKKYGKNVSDRDEAVSPDDIYHSEKLEIIYEK